MNFELLIACFNDITELGRENFFSISVELNLIVISFCYCAILFDILLEVLLTFNKYCNKNGSTILIK